MGWSSFATISKKKKKKKESIWWPTGIEGVDIIRPRGIGANSVLSQAEYSMKVLREALWTQDWRVLMAGQGILTMKLLDVTNTVELL